MSLTNTTNYTETRLQIITRALRIVNLIGEGETPTTQALSEGNIALNQLIKAWEADGMPLWAIEEYSFTPITGTRQYNIGLDAYTTRHAPLKVLQVWLRDTCGETDTPVILRERYDYNLIGNKFIEGQTTQAWYDPPRAIDTGAQLHGVLTLWPVPDVEMATNKQVFFTGQRPFYDMSSDSNNLDFPSYWDLAVTWGLADQMTYQSGLPLSERAMITKKMERHKEEALSFGVEEGSLRIQPAYYYWQKNS